MRATRKRSVLAEAIVGDAPLVSVFVSKQLCAGHPEHSPALCPARCIGIAIDLAQHCQHLVTIAILVLQPVIGGIAIMAARQQPALLQHQRDRKSTRLNSSHSCAYRMPSYA